MQVRDMLLLSLLTSQVCMFCSTLAFAKPNTSLHKVKLTVLAPDFALVQIDGVSHYPGNVTVEVSSGVHVVSVPEIIPVSFGTRLVFDRWSDDLTNPSRTVYLKNSTKLEAMYVRQHSLHLESMGPVMGEGWCNEGSVARFSVPSTQSMVGVLGFLGGTWRFQGWYENGILASSSSSGSIEMDAPHTLVGRWASDLTMPEIIAALVAIAVALAIIIRRQATKLRAS